MRWPSLSTLVGTAILALPGICLSNKRLSTGNSDNSCEWKLMIRSEGESRNSGTRRPVTRVSCQPRLLTSVAMRPLKNRVAWVTNRPRTETRFRAVCRPGLWAFWRYGFTRPILYTHRHIQSHCVPRTVQLFPHIDRKFSAPTGSVCSRISYWLLYWTRHIFELFRDPMEFIAQLVRLCSPRRLSSIWHPAWRCAKLSYLS